MVVAPCPEAIAQGDSTGGLAARSRELLLQLTSHDETPENSTPRPRDKVRGAEEAGGHPVGHVRAAGARDGRGVRVQGGAGGQAAGLAGEVAGGRAAAGPRQVRHGGRCRLVPRQVGVRARGRRRGGLRAVVPGPDRMNS